jgi:hypothetical protein
VACSMPPRARCRGGCWPGWGSATIEAWFHLLLACTLRSQLKGVRDITPGLLRSGGARSHLHDDVRVQTVELSEQGVWQGLDSRTQRHHGHAFRGGTQVAGAHKLRVLCDACCVVTQHSMLARAGFWLPSSSPFDFEL